MNYKKILITSEYQKLFFLSNPITVIQTEERVRRKRMLKKLKIFQISSNSETLFFLARIESIN